MKPEQIQKINEGLLKKTGVDFSRYRNSELTDTIANAVTFPLYFARSVSRPVGLFLAATVLAILFVESGFYKTFLTFPGLILAIVNGFLLGLVLFVRRIRNDMDKVFSISADISLQVVRDIGAVRSNLESGALEFPSLLEIFQGVNAVIVLPTVVRILDRKIPLFGGLAARITEKFFSVVDSRLASAIKAKNLDGNSSAQPLSSQEVSKWLETAGNMVDFGKGILSQIVNKVAMVVAFPFLTVFTIIFLISAAILYGGYALMG
jgi:hypothetical protein